ncbi:MAG: TlpA disulfide reductase family protein [Thermoanaerobaculia bacterium]
MASRSVGALLLLSLLFGGCAREAAAPDPAGVWRAVLASPGGDLPFGLRIERRADGLSASILNGPEAAPVSDVVVEGDSIELAFSWYDSRIDAPFAGPDRLTGTWTKTHHHGSLARMAFTAERGEAPRFPTPDETGAVEALPTVAGDWDVLFVDDETSEPARAELTQEGDHVSGTFLTTTGDYRYLEGIYRGGALRLSTFDGAHAFLFHAVARPDGTLEGDYWSRDTYHAHWTGSPIAAEVENLSDGWHRAGLANDEGRFHFSFPDLEGRTVSLSDPRFDGKVVLVNLFGSWCPNCNDEAPLLAEWARRYRDRGLEVVGLAYEMTGDPERNRTFVARYRDRHGIDFPLLLAGTSDKAEASETLPDLDAVLAFPTTVFIGRDGKVASIYSGFSGPGTGAHHDELVAQMESTIERLLGS